MDWLVVGLGNPGQAYTATRHNIGFLVVEHMARRLGASFSMQKKAKAEVARMLAPAQQLSVSGYLAKPQTFMNLSGEAVRALLDYYKLDVDRLLIITDDMSLPFGRLRLRASGSDGGHNGLASIAQHLGHTRYGRLKIGVGPRAGKPVPANRWADYVLGRWDEFEARQMETVIQAADTAVMDTMRLGLDAAIAKHNGWRAPWLLTAEPAATGTGTPLSNVTPITKDTQR